MKKFFNHVWKILLMTVVYNISVILMGLLLPLSNDMYAAMTPEDQVLSMPLFFLNSLINFMVVYVLLKLLRYKGWKLFGKVLAAVFGLFTLLNSIELYWYIEAFPLYTYMDVTKQNLIALISYALTCLLGACLVHAFKEEKKAGEVFFDAGTYWWKVGVFCVVYPLFYYACGFIPWLLFPGVQEFYGNWAATTEPIPVLLLFNVLRGALWLLFSLPILKGVTSRKQAFWLMPLVLVTGTAVATMIPSALMPGYVRIAHFVELGFSMTVVGIFMVILFVRGKTNKEVKNE